MARPTTSWTAAAAVNGLMAVILLIWLADGPTRGSNPRPTAQAPDPDRVAERSRGRRAEPPAAIDLPPPPSLPAPAMRPSTRRESERPIEIVPLRAAEQEPSPIPGPVPTPFRPAGDRPVAPPPVGAPAVVQTPAVAETPPNAESVAAVRATVRTGRILLRILEHGEGPAIEIAWPGSIAERGRLHDILRRCFGMRLALIDQAGRLYLDAGPKGRAWPIDLDRYSGFVRRPNGRITAAERRAAGRVARYHHRLPATDPVRLFPRAADAALLGGLVGLLGDDYRSATAIMASYRLRGGRVTVGDIRIDGRRVAGEIDLTRGARASCRRPGRI